MTKINLNKNSLFVGVCETWLHPKVADAEVSHNFDGFTIYRRDHKNRQGGGVALYVKESFCSDVICTFDNNVCQSIVVLIHELNTCLCVCYRPPDTRLEEFSEMLKSIDSAFLSLPTPTPNIVLMGDMNFPRSSIEWEFSDEGDIYPTVQNHRSEVTVSGKQDRLQATGLVDLAAKHCLQQFVDGPTRGGEILDLIWSNNSEMISNFQREDCTNFSDHKLITANTTYILSESNSEIKEEYLCESGRRLAEIDWTSMINVSGTKPDEALSIFHSNVLNVLEASLAKRKPKRSGTKSKMDRMRSRIWRRIAKLKAKLKTSKTLAQKAKNLQNLWKAEKELFDDYDSINNAQEDQAVMRLKENPKSFYSFARSRQNTKAKVGPFLDPETGVSDGSPEYCSKALQLQYESVFATPRPQWVVSNIEEHFAEDSETGTLPDLVFFQTDIEEACSSLTSTAASGPDGVPAALLKFCAKQMSLPLFHLWRGSLDCGSIPAELLLVIICPIHKGGPRTVPKQYRPVALTSHLIKVFERVLRKRLVWLLTSRRTI